MEDAPIHGIKTLGTWFLKAWRETGCISCRYDPEAVATVGALTPLARRDEPLPSPARGIDRIILVMSFWIQQQFNSRIFKEQSIAIEKKWGFHRGVPSLVCWEFYPRIFLRMHSKLPKSQLYFYGQIMIFFNPKKSTFWQLAVFATLHLVNLVEWPPKIWRADFVPYFQRGDSGICLIA